MQVTVQGHSMNISQRLDKYCRAKAEKLDRYLPGVEDVRIEFTRESAKADALKSVELTVRRRRTLLRVEERNTDPFLAFDSALDKMYQRIARYKGRRTDRKRGGVGPDDKELLEAEDLPIETTPDGAVAKLVRIKTFSIMPMSTDEAVEQMELLGHDFFVFVHQDDGAIKVIYRRKSGDYGLLQPER